MEYLEQFFPLILFGLFILTYVLRRKKSMEALKNLDPNALVLDVRSPGEFATGNVPGSLNIPVSDLPRRIGEIEKTRSIVVCCASGGRSAMAAAILKGNGFQKIHDVGPWQNAMKRG